MLRIRQILVSSLALAASAGSVSGCGQTGSLYLPTEPAAARRATLPEVLVPGRSPSEPAPPPPSSPTVRP